MIVDSLAFDFDQDKTDREAERRDREAELREREREREAQWYSEGQNAADEYRWDRALSYFNRVVELKGSKADAALYWKAFSQNRLGQRTEALATIAELSKSHPNSPYRRQATVLEAEVKRDIGQPVRPQDSADDEVKLMALQALQNTAPEEAVPMLEKVLEGTSSRKVKQRALYVLAQSKSPRAREVLRNYAKGSSTPELQSQAIQYLGVHGGPEARAVLAEVYGTTTDVDVKRRILRAFMVAGEKDRLFKAAQGEQNPELRARGGQPAWQHGGARGALAALSEGVLSRCEAAHHPLDDGRRQRRPADRAGQERAESRSCAARRCVRSGSCARRAPATCWCRSTAATTTSTSRNRWSTRSSSRTTPRRWSGSRARSRT